MGRTKLKGWLVALCLWACIAPMQANDGWTIYASYHNATKAVKADSRIFVMANGNLFSYDAEDKVVELYDKANGLGDFGLYDIAYSSTAKTMVLLYENGNIDLLSLNGHIWNMSDLKRKNLNDRTLNELKVVGSEALISTNSGLALIDLNEGYFVDFYTFDSKVTHATIQNERIYVKTEKEVMEGDRKLNLLDASNWRAVPANTVTFGPTAEEKAEGEALLEQMKNIVPNSPVRNYSYHLYTHGNRLLVAGGNFYYPGVDYTGTALKYENGKWTAFDEQEAIALVGELAYMNVTDVVQDPNDSEHHWLGTVRSGIYEFKDYKLKKHYTYDNSPITSILPKSAHADWYVRVTGLAYDPDGNLWMMNNECDTIVRVLKKDGKWTSIYVEDIVGNTTFDKVLFDRRGWMWSNSRRDANEWRRAGILVMNYNSTLSTNKDDKYKFIKTFHNQDGVSYDPTYVYCITETLDGSIWIGTNLGLFVSEEPGKVFDNDFYLNHGFDRQSNTAGALFVDKDSAQGLPQSNYIIYGHNMKDESMFGTFKEYMNESYYEENPTLYYLTPNANYRVDLFGVHIVEGTTDNYPTFFSSGNYGSYLDEVSSEFYWFKKDAVNTACQMMTLSTCTTAAGLSDARLVLHGTMVPIE